MSVRVWNVLSSYFEEDGAEWGDRKGQKRKEERKKERD